MSECLRGWSEAVVGDIRRDDSASIDPRSHGEEEFDLYSVPACPTRLPEVVLGQAVGSHKQVVEPGTVLVCKINPRINRVWVVGSSRGARQIASTEWIPFFPIPGISPRFLAYQFRRDHFRNYLAGNVSGVGGSLMRVRPSVLDGYRVMVAPIEEQERILQAIESYLSRLDEAAATLERVQRNLKRYRASVLKAAFEGRLVPTEAELAHAEGRAFEPATQLIDRIVERHHGVRAESSRLDAKSLRVLPAGWTWASMEQVLEDRLIGLVRGKHEQDTARSGCRYLKMDAIGIDGSLALDALPSVEVTESEQRRFALHAGDIVFNTRNSVELVGKCAYVPAVSGPVVFNNNIMRMRCVQEVDARFVAYQMCASPFRSQLEDVKRATTSVAAIYAKDLLPLPLAIPPMSEQKRIVAEVDRLLSVDAARARELDAALRRLARLRQSILKWAFEGKLADQDPNAEPASVLLERIKAERAAAAAAPKSRVKKPRAKVTR